MDALLSRLYAERTELLTMDTRSDNPDDSPYQEAAILTNNELAQTIADLKATVQKFENDLATQKAAHSAEMERLQSAMKETGAQQDTAGPHPLPLQRFLQSRKMLKGSQP